MKNRIVELLVVGVLTAPMAVQAASIVTSVDTASQLTGTFSFSGDLDTQNGFAPLQFALGRPDGDFCDFLQGGRTFNDFGAVGSFGTTCATSPDDAFSNKQLTGSAQTFPDRGGMYNAAAGGGTINTVFFRFFDWSDTGGADGTFSGAFCFSTSPTGCAASVPEPGTLALFGLGLMGLGLTRRKVS